MEPVTPQRNVFQESKSVRKFDKGRELSSAARQLRPGYSFLHFVVLL